MALRLSTSSSPHGSSTRKFSKAGFELKTLSGLVEFAVQPTGDCVKPVGANHAVVAVSLLRDGMACWGGGVSWSMAPFVRPSDRLMIQPIGPREIRRGDLVAVHRDGEIVVHRVFACQTNGYWTKGDAMLFLDPFVPKEVVLGRAVALELPTDRRVQLDTLPWSAVQRGLGWVAWCAAQICPSLRPPWLRRLFWRLLRLPFYAAATFARRGRAPAHCMAPPGCASLRIDGGSKKH